MYRRKGCDSVFYRKLKNYVLKGFFNFNGIDTFYVYFYTQYSSQYMLIHLLAYVRLELPISI